MSQFEVNPHTLRVAAGRFNDAANHVNDLRGSFVSRVQSAGSAYGNGKNESAYNDTFGKFATAIGNLHTSLANWHDELMSAAEAYAQTDENIVIQGTE